MIRFFHWSLALLVSGLLVTSQVERFLPLHAWFGQALVPLLLLRLLWGFVGNEYARFSDFIKGPKETLEHLKALKRGQNERFLGHNPLAGWVFILMGLSLLALTVSGLVLLGGQEEIGVFAALFTPALAARFAPWHEAFAWGMGLLVLAHLAGMLKESLLQKENLPLAMLTGKKALRNNQPKSQLTPKPWLQALLILGILGGSGYYLTLGPMQSHNAETLRADRKEKGKYFALYQEECGDCHFEFPPNLLPRRSWERMMKPEELEAHFEEDVSLEEETRVKILSHLTTYAQETSHSEVAYYLSEEIGPTQSPLQFSHTNWWKERHEDIDAETYKKEKIGGKLNCKACHAKAAYGSFEDRDIYIPD